MTNSKKNVKWVIRNIRKTFFIYVYPFFLKRLKVIPKRAYFSSYGGQHYSDSPKIISEKLMNTDDGFDIVWQIRDKKAKIVFPEEYNVVENYSLKSAFYLSTSKFIIGNSIMDFKYKKKDQIYIQCWHGTPLKKIEQDAKDKLSNRYIKKSIYNSKNIDMLISGNKYSTGIYKSAFGEKVPIYELGTPRIDNILTGLSDENYIKMIKERLNIKDELLVTYAPTFRTSEGENSKSQIDMLNPQLIRKTFEEKFNRKCKLLLKFHPNTISINTMKRVDDDSIVNVTNKINMEDLLTISDILITDYSSSFFDFALTNKPIFLYFYDYESYLNERGMYLGEKELPLLKSYSQDELIKQIKNTPVNELIDRSQNLLKFIGNKEDGYASERIIKYIYGNIGKLS